MSTVTITGTVTDSAGASGSYTVIVMLDSVIINSAIVTPDPAPAGTLRTLTINATSAGGLALTFNTPTSPGVTFTPVSGHPNQFTFTV